jgi:uncharacterized membrane protein YgcG
MQIDLPGEADRFEAALAERQGWSLPFAERVTGEYRRFLYLAATAEFEATPSQSVDEAWHFHLTLPHYREILCERILRRPLEHRPGTGSAEDDARCARQYEKTVALYERAFLSAPPAEVWPLPAGSENKGLEGQRGRRVGLAGGAALVAGLAAPALGTPALGSMLLIGAAILGVLYFPFQAFPARPGGSGSCGGSCGGSSCGSNDGGGCGASCGGGCGGH